MGNLTKEASRLKYQYNKKYMDAYWNRKAEKLKEEKRKEEEDDREEIRTAIQKAMETEERVSVSRNGMSDQQYIAALENSNKCLSKENRRLVNLLTKQNSKLKKLQAYESN